MRVKIAIAILCLFAFTVVAAYAETVKITEGNYVALGWKKTTKVGPEPGQSVTFMQRADTSPGYVPGLQTSPKKSETNNRAWAGLSTMIAPGTLLSTVNHFRVRTAGFEGDGAEWEPPSIYVGVTRDGTNARNLRALPYATFGRASSWTFYEYDLLNTKWICNVATTPVKTWSEWPTLYPNLQFSTEAQCSGIPSSQNFNAFSGVAINEEVKYGSSVRGMIDWVEIGFTDGAFYKFDFAVSECALNNKSAKDGIIGVPGPVVRYVRHVVFGKVLADPPPGSGYFYLSDGAGPLRVNATGYTATVGQFVRAAGFLNNVPTPAELGCSASDVTVF